MIEQRAAEEAVLRWLGWLIVAPSGGVDLRRVLPWKGSGRAAGGVLCGSGEALGAGALGRPANADRGAAS